jgi:hypothetical protein
VMEGGITIKIIRYASTSEVHTPLSKIYLQARVEHAPVHGSCLGTKLVADSRNIQEQGEVARV